MRVRTGDGGLRWFVVLMTLLLGLLVAPDLLACEVTPKECKMLFDGRVYDVETNRTSFSYTVMPTKACEGISFFLIEISKCDALVLVSTTPQEVEVGKDPHTGYWGAKWDLGLEPGHTRTYVLVFAGNVPLGEVGVALKVKTTVLKVKLPGAACDVTCMPGDGVNWNVGDPCSWGTDVCQRSGKVICNEQGALICNAVPWLMFPDEPPCDGVTERGENLCEPPIWAETGLSCSDGIGACYREGKILCDIDGNPYCTAVSGTPTCEVCDGVDNNCDGLVDNSPVCYPTNDDGQPDPPVIPDPNDNGIPRPPVVPNPNDTGPPPVNPGPVTPGDPNPDLPGPVDLPGDFQSNDPGALTTDNGYTLQGGACNVPGPSPMMPPTLLLFLAALTLWLRRSRQTSPSSPS